MIGRKKDSYDVAGYPTAIDNAYNDKAGALKMLGPQMGHLILLGALGSALAIAKGRIIWVFNSDTAVHYVATGASGMSAPSTPANGIPIPAGQYIAISNAGDGFIRADSATVYGYQVDDESVYTTPQAAP